MTDDILSLAQAATAKPIAAPGFEGDVLLIPDGYSDLDMEEYGDHPRRTNVAVRHQTLGSFLRYYDRFTGGQPTAPVFVDRQNGILRAEFDYHSLGQPAWRGHVATFDLPVPQAWKTWTEYNNRYMTQKDFAEHLIDNQQDIVKPEPASMIELAKTIRGTVDVTFASGHDLKNGDVELRYNRETKAKGGTSGSIAIPDVFVLGLRPYLGAEPYEVKAFLRYRIDDDGTLRLLYKLHRIDLVKEDALEAVLKQVREAVGEDNVFDAVPSEP